MQKQPNNAGGESKVQNAACTYAVNHWPVFPCNPLDKRPLTQHGFKDATLDSDTIRQWWKLWPNAMIGIPMGEVSGIFCIDLDKKQGGHDGVASWKKLLEENSAIVATRRHITPSSGEHLVFIYEAGIRNIPLDKLAPGIEVKGEGGYIVVPPSKMADGREYQLDDQDIAHAPQWLLKMINGYLNRDDFEKEIEKDAGKGTRKEDFLGFGPIDPEMVRAALLVIPSDNYDIWFRIAGALKKEFGEVGFKFFEEWSRKSRKFTMKACLRKWKDADDITEKRVDTIFAIANEYQPGWRQEFHKKQQTEEQSSSQKSETKQSIVLTDEEFVARYKSPSYIITGLLQKRFVYSLTGMTGSGKTCVALRIAAHVIRGVDLNGRKVKQGKVLYFAGENPDDVLVRWIKLCEEMKISHKESMMHWLPGVPPLKNTEIRKRIYAAAQLYGPFSMVVIDTSAAYFQGDDENNNAQLGEHARLMRRFAQLPGNPTVLVTCHPTKHPDLNNLLPRGGGAFINEMDGNLSCTLENLLVEISTHGKFRGPEFAPFTFKLHPCKLNDLKDEDGGEIWSVIAVPITDEEYVSMEDAMEKKRDELIRLMLNRPGLSLNELAVELGWTNNDGRPNKSLVQRLIGKLLFEKKVEKKGGHYTLTKKTAEKMQQDQPRQGKSNQEDLL